MKVTVGGGYYDNRLGMVRLPNRVVDAPDDWVSRAMSAMVKTSSPTHILMSPEIAKMIRDEMDKL